MNNFLFFIAALIKHLNNKIQYIPYFFNVSNIQLN